MSEQIRLEDFHEQIVVDTFAGQSLNDQDYFLLFCLLHNYKIAVTPGVLDRTDLADIHALTQRGAADSLEVC